MANKRPSWQPEPGEDSLGTDPDPVPPRPPPPRGGERIPSGLPLPVHHGFSTTELLTESPDSKLELQWRSYAQDPNRPGPRPHTDGRRVTRKLNAFERWALEPYFIDEDLEATIYNGVLPPVVAKELAKRPEIAEQVRKAGIDLKNIKPGQAPLALTYGTRRDITIWFPVFQPKLWHRFWLGVLAHELAHGAQGRMGGLQAGQLEEMFRRHGYEDSPTEVQARWVQGGVLRGLDKRAMAHKPAAGTRPPTSIEVPEQVIPGSARTDGAGWAWLLVLVALSQWKHS